MARSLRFGFSALLAAIALLVVGAGGAAADPPPPAGTPSAVSFSGVPNAGPLFFNGLSSAHGCSASVVKSPGRNLVLTAAHCISGTGAGIQFVPGYNNGKTPYGVWTVQKAWVAPSWISSQDPKNDYAFLQVAPQVINGRMQELGDVVAGYLLGVAVRAGTTVTDVAYPHGLDDQPVKCTTKISYTSGYPTFNCDGYPGGTSGSPFLVRIKGLPGIVTGVIGGLHQGGCYVWNSFSSPFGLETYRTYLRAVSGRTADTVPSAGSDGC